MRNVMNLNRKWAFRKAAGAVPAEVPKDWDFVNLPHSWNAIDGQDGNGDYYRGTAFYAKSIDKLDLPKGEKYFLEIRGANSSAKVYWNGKLMAEHHGGYSTWRVDVSAEIADTNLIVFELDNAPNKTVYPQTADFTFYGGLYRDVNLIAVPASHFDLEFFGGSGLTVTPVMDGDHANVDVQVWVKNKQESQKLKYTLKDAAGHVVAEAVSDDTKASFVLENAHKWHGRKDPYLYTASVQLLDGEAVLDCVTTRFGCRSFAVDPERGFILNGEEYPLRGVARHQDRWGVGNGLLPEHHEEDMDLICEVGANTIRLAHYQHDQYFYDLCDERGMVIWAEIPYITGHLTDGVENTVSQMKELVIQNYNHPSVVVWGLSNEINAGNGMDDQVVPNHVLLNDICHELDKTRLTTLAAVSACDTDHEYLRIPNCVSYNQYFGWYGGELSDYGTWFDKFHADHPDIPIGVSEYGCEALNWHNSRPEPGDYSEEYQAIYHEEVIKQLFPRKYLWATHVWNMFDFGADGRNEGGEDGQNHKGLVTFDRKYKKDSFYAYKAWLSDAPFVHIGGKRYVDRVEDVTKVTVYSNQPSVELFANGVSLGVKVAEGHFFRFEVPNVGTTHLTAVAGEWKDESVIHKVPEPNPDYILKEKGAVLNWWDITEVEGCCSLNTKVRTVIASAGMDETCNLLKPILGPTADPRAIGVLDSQSVLRMVNLLTGMLRIPVTKEQLMELNQKLNRIHLKV